MEVDVIGKTEAVNSPVGPELTISVCHGSQRKIGEAYQAVLRAQMEEQQQLLCAERARAESDSQQRLMEEEVYNQKKDEFLSRPTSHTMRQHPFRRAEAASAASAGHFM